MGLKEFFKITWGKFFFIIFFNLIGIFIYFMGIGCAFSSEGLLCMAWIDYSLFLGFALGTFAFNSLYFLVLLQIIYSYLLACILIWLIEKIKNRNVSISQNN